MSDDTFTVHGSWGQVTADHDGYVIDADASDGGRYQDIVRLDLAEYRAWLARLGWKDEGTADILSVGYWWVVDGSGGYEPPEPEHREAMEWGATALHISEKAAELFAGRVRGERNADT